MNTEEIKVIDKIISHADILRSREMLLFGLKYNEEASQFSEEEKEAFIKRTQSRLDFVISFLEGVKQHPLSNNILEKLTK